MRSMVFGTALGAAAATLTLAFGALAQPGAAPGADPGGPAGPATPSDSAVSVGLSTEGAGAAVTGVPVDEGVSEEDEAAEEKKPEKLAWRGTQFVFDQSATTQSIGLGDDYISDNPTYEMNFSFRPRYYVYDADDHSVNFNAVLELTQELTNSDYTTRENELLFGNIMLNASYGYIAYKNNDGVVTQLSVGPRVVFPTSKAAWRSGQRLQIGGGLGLTQAFPVAGAKSSWFPSAAVTGSAYYMKPLQKSTTGENEDFERERQDINAQSIASNQISAGARVNHQVTAMTAASLDVTPKFHLTGSYVWVMQWAYSFDETEVQPAGVGGLTVTPDEYDDATNFRVLPWFLVSADYDLLPEVGLSAGYYNVTNQLGPDGTRRNPLWSPEARVFFDITANLDQIYMRLSGSGDEKAAKRATARARQEARAKSIQTASSY